MKKKISKEVVMRICLITISCCLVIGLAITLPKIIGSKKEREKEQAQSEKQVSQPENINVEQNKDEEFEISFLDLIVIENKKEFVVPVMKSWSYLLDQEVNRYILENEIEVEEAKCLDCSISAENQNVTEFYIQLRKGAKSSGLVTAKYDPDQNTVIVEECQYSLKEIKKGVWNPNNESAPAIRDVE